MGDRANIALHFDAFDADTPLNEEKNVIYLYSHWDGPDLAVMLKKALIRGTGRWGDDPYLARIIFSEMIQNNVLDETGYGLSPYVTDNSYPYANVYLRDQEVEINGKKWSFEKYVKAKDSTLLKHMSGREDEEN